MVLGLCLSVGSSIAQSTDSTQAVPAVASTPAVTSSTDTVKVKRKRKVNPTEQTATTTTTMVKRESVNTVPAATAPAAPSVSAPASAGLSELQAINKSANALYVKPETLDQLMIRLRPFFQQPRKETDSLFMITLKTITNGYVVNNHFKQGYFVYLQYLRFKESRLKSDLDASVAAANAAVNERRQKEDDELLSLKNTVDELQDDINGYKGKRAAFKTYFSIAIIVLSMIVAAMLVSTGVRLNNLRNRIKQNRENLISSHRKSTLGALSKGLLDTIRSNVQTIGKDVKQLISGISGASGDKAREIGKRLS